MPKSPPVTRARLRITADNGYRVLLDGRELGRGSDWRSLTEYDVTQLLSPGTHVLAVEGFNDRLAAGVLAGLKIEFADGKTLEVASDDSWRVVPETASGWTTEKHAPSDWPPAKVVGALGTAPWKTMPYAVITVPHFRPITVRFWQTGWFQVSLLSICGIVVLVCLRLMMELALQAKAERLLQRERDRMARDLHDDLGSGLTQLVLEGELTQSDLPAGSEKRAQIDQLCEKARHLGHLLDEVIWAINSRRDTLRDFTTHVCKYAQAFLQSTPIRCRLDVEMELPPVTFDLPIRRNLFLAVKEALNNAAKHSQADELFLRIHRHETGLWVAVEDNGIGFHPAGAGGERNGLANMAQRMAEVGGECRVRSQPGKGCRVEFKIPRLHVRAGILWLKWRRARRSGNDQIARDASAENRVSVARTTEIQTS